MDNDDEVGAARTGVRRRVVKRVLREWDIVEVGD